MREINIDNYYNKKKKRKTVTMNTIDISLL